MRSCDHRNKDSSESRSRVMLTGGFQSTLPAKRSTRGLNQLVGLRKKLMSTASGI